MADEVPGLCPAPVVTPDPAPASLAASPPSGETPAPAAAAADPAKPAEPEKKEEAPAPAAFAPDKLTLPEGLKADDPSLKTFNDIFGDDKLSPQERGQKLLDLYADVTKQGREAATAAWTDVNKKWQETTMADPEIGGAKFPAAKATIAKAIDTLGPNLAAEVRQALDVTGAGNHPAIVKALHGFAVRLTEPGHVAGQPPGARSAPSVKEAFYPNSPDMK